MKLIQKNLRYLRNQEGLTQQEFADLLGIKRSLIGSYEEGRADPRIPTLVQIAQKFNLSIDDLVNRDLSKVRGEAPQPGNPRVLSITVTPEGKENVELVPQRAAAGYLNGYSDPEYLEKLPRFHLPMLPDNETYRAFEISGDSMLPLQPGTVVIGKYVESFRDIKSGKTYILVTSSEGVVYKRVFNYLEEEGKLFLVSDNKLYAPFEIKGEEVLETWEARVFISFGFPDFSHAAQVSIDQLTEVVGQLKEEIVKLRG